MHLHLESLLRFITASHYALEKYEGRSVLVAECALPVAAVRADLSREGIDHGSYPLSKHVRIAVDCVISLSVTNGCKITTF